MLDFISDFWLITLFALVIGHAVGDFALQGEFMAAYKSRQSAKPFENEGHPWVIILSAHSLIHAGMVWVITGMWYLAFAEFVLHWIIDFLKGEQKTCFMMDQLLHVLCKVVYVGVLVVGGLS